MACYAEEDFRRALKRLPTDQRESLILVGASGFSYEEAGANLRMRVGNDQEAGSIVAASDWQRSLRIESAKILGPAPENVRGAPLVVRDGGRRQDSPLPQRGEKRNRASVRGGQFGRVRYSTQSTHFSPHRCHAPRHHREREEVEVLRRAFDETSEYTNINQNVRLVSHPRTICIF